MGKVVSQESGSLRERAQARSLTRRDFLLASAGAGAGLYFLGMGGGPGSIAQAQVAPSSLEVFGGHPRAFFYRHVEGEARSGDVPFADWEKRYLPLGGLLGKVLNEEHDYSDTNTKQYFLDYKQRNPTKMVLLHYNGTGRRAEDEALTRFSSGHWLYYKGTKLTQAVGNRSTEKVLRVQDTSVFKMKRYRIGVSDDIAVVRINPDGRPLWETAEHVRLEAIDNRNKTITVKRGKYGSTRGAFPAGSYLAAHVTTGPYRYEDSPEQSIPIWNYNFSTLCPKDAQGRNCADALVEYLGEKLGPGGELASLDGIVFDVFSWVIRFGSPIQDIDVNTDGVADRGMFRGVNVVSKGALAFLQKLRERLPGKILLADGHIPRESQRGFGYLNGTESEGYPDKYDIQLDHVSRGENIVAFWKRNSTTPPFNYINYRYKETKPEKYRNTFVEPNLSEDRSYRKLRLVLASALFNDAVFTCSGGDLLQGGQGWLPPAVPWRAQGNTPVRVFDELWKGTEQQPNWLGMPKGPAVHMAERTADRYQNRGVTWPQAFVNLFSGTGVAFSRVGTTARSYLKIRSTEPGGGMQFNFPNINVTGEDLLVVLRLRAQPLVNFPATVPRRVDVIAVPSGGSVEPANTEFTWADGDPFTAYFYFQDVGPGNVQIRVVVEGDGEVYFESLKAHSAIDIRYREFDNGVVFANPSPRAHTFNISNLPLVDPGLRLRRLQGSQAQDPETNDRDRPVGESLTLFPKDGLFLEKVR